MACYTVNFIWKFTEVNLSVSVIAIITYLYIEDVAVNIYFRANRLECVSVVSVQVNKAIYIYIFFQSALTAFRPIPTNYDGIHLLFSYV